MKQLLFSIFLLISYNAISQPLFQIYNLDFEADRSRKVPVGWIISKEGKKNGFTFNVDTMKSVNGLQSGVLFNYTSGENKFGSGFQSIDATPYRGKTIQFSGFFKSQLIENSDASLFLAYYIDQQGKEKVADYGTEKIKDETWSLHSLKLDIPLDAVKINFGINLNGKGEVNADFLKLEIINNGSRDAVSNSVLTENDFENILKVGETWANLRYFMPSDESQRISQEALIINALYETLQNKDAEKAIVDNFKPVFPAYFSEGTLKPEDASDNQYLIYKHVGAPNFGSPSYAYSEIKNIYFTDRKREAAVFQKVDVSDHPEDKYEITCRVKVKQKNPTGQAQIWLKFDKTSGNDERITNFDNFVTEDGWNLYTVKGKFPKNVSKMTVGLVALGELTAYFDDLKIKIIDLDKGEDFLMLNPNTSFEEKDQDGLPQKWTIPISVFGIGYDVKVTDEDSFDNDHSLKIESDKRKRYEYPKEGEKLGSIKIPSGIYKNRKGTLPKSELKAPDPDYFFDINDDISKIALAIDAIAHHDLFFDSNEKIFQNKEKFKKIIESFLKAETYLELEFALTRIFSTTKDAYFRTWHLNDELFSAPFKLKKFSDGIFISGIHPNEKELQIGDKIIKINGKKIENVIDEYKSLQPAANQEYSINRALALVPIGNENEEITLTREDGKVFKRSKKYIPQNIFENPKNNIFEVRKGTVYIDPSLFDDKLFKEMIKEYGSSIKNMIIDARDNLNLSEYFLGHFSDNDFKGHTNKIPVYTSPEHRSFQTLENVIKGNLTLHDYNLYFLVDENTYGYSESIVSIAKYNDLATLIGTKTGGSPGESAAIRLIGGFNYSKNITQVYDPSGNLYNGKPILPDVIVEESSASLRSDIDELLQRTIEIIENK